MSSSDWKQPRPAGRVKRCVDALAEALESNGELTDEYIVEQVLDAWAARNPAEVAWDYQQAGAAVRASRRADL